MLLSTWIKHAYWDKNTKKERFLLDLFENSLVFIVLLHKRGHILYFGCTLSHLIIIKLEFTFREMISSFWQCQSDNLVNLVHVLPLRQEYVWRYHKW